VKSAGFWVLLKGIEQRDGARKIRGKEIMAIVDEICISDI